MAEHETEAERLAAERLAEMLDEAEGTLAEWREQYPSVAGYADYLARIVGFYIPDTDDYCWQAHEELLDFLAGRRAVRATPADAGCWVSGWHGRYATLAMIHEAEARGWRNPDPLPYGYDDAQDAERNIDREVEVADAAEAWMNAYVAPQGYGFGWHDGEFFLMADAEWQEVGP